MSRRNVDGTMRSPTLVRIIDSRTSSLSRVSLSITISVTIGSVDGTRRCCLRNSAYTSGDTENRASSVRIARAADSPISMASATRSNDDEGDITQVRLNQEITVGEFGQLFVDVLLRQDVDHLLGHRQQ